ncbi:hypothetical protein P280DRAFT_522819 [Massarina eburnea CBS 473.64]|uniref:Uncharacterized protein n=1 Tax=Massarina eburnea CBS 473.64 TaxID=1395130 RepID=A0A6A6RJJ0_9PLEO|nr:hypothetical protein P280DRAFT_522819 [Massarina eburnea CBS 473.64]
MTSPYQTVRSSIGAVNRNFFNLASPYAFQTVTLGNTEKSGQSVRAVTKGALAETVKDVVYLALLPVDNTDPIYKDLSAPPKSEYFPDVVEEVLANLCIFPNSDRLCIEFQWRQGEYAHYVAESKQANSRAGQVFFLAEIDRNHAWRNLMFNSYTAVARNGSGMIKTLELRNLVCRLPLRGNGSMGMASTWYFESWPIFLDSLHFAFFEHMEALQSLEVVAPEDGYLGINDGTLCRLPYSEKHMPRLEMLVLHRVFLCLPMMDFVFSRARTLRLEFRAAFGTTSGFVSPQGLGWGLSFEWMAREREDPFDRLVYSNVVCEVPEWQKAELQEDAYGRFLYGVWNIGRGSPRARITDWAVGENGKRDERAWAEVMEMVGRNRGREVEL